MKRVFISLNKDVISIYDKIIGKAMLSILLIVCSHDVSLKYHLFIAFAVTKQKYLGS